MMLSMFFIVRATVTSTLNSPIGGNWISSFPMNFSFVCNSNSTAFYNATLYHNVSGTWKANYTLGFNGSQGGGVNSSVTYNFTETTTLSDALAITWSVLCRNNETGESTFADNNTFKIDTTKPTVPKIGNPTNHTVLDVANPIINWTNTSEANFNQYKIQFANDTDFESVDIVREQLVTSRTTETVTFNNAVPLNRQYWLRVLAEDKAGNTAYEYVNVTLISGAPTISIVNFSDNIYQSDSTPTFAITATHQFVANCSLYLTNVTTNGTEFTSSTANNTPLWARNNTNSLGNGTLGFTATAMADGVYRFAFICANIGNNISSFTSNRSITIDTTSPADFGCFAPNNDTKRIDHTPLFQWNETVETNFGNYSITADNNSDFSSPELIDVVSVKNQTWYEANLRSYNNSDRNWYWRINSTDLAGNTRVTTNCTSFYYRTDVTNHWLRNGWNIVALMESGTINASDLGKGLGANWVTISRFNNSKEFENYNNGSSTKADMLFKKGDVVFFNVNDNTYWENQTWDTDTNYNSGGLVNITNISSNWNIIGIQNQSGRTIGNIEQMWLLSNRFINESVPYGGVIKTPDNASLMAIVYFNNSADATKRYVPHPFNYSFNNATTVDFGGVVWININASWNISSIAYNGTGYVTLNRTVI